MDTDDSDNITTVAHLHKVSSFITLFFVSLIHLNLYRTMAYYLPILHRRFYLLKFLVVRLPDRMTSRALGLGDDDSFMYLYQVHTTRLTAR